MGKKLKQQQNKKGPQDHKKNRLLQNNHRAQYQQNRPTQQQSSTNNVNISKQGEQASLEVPEMAEVASVDADASRKKRGTLLLNTKA